MTSLNTAQEVFDFVANHLITQGRPALLSAKQKASISVSGVRCAYRADSGDSCAVGCLISPEAYSPTMEGASIRALINGGQHHLIPHVVLLSNLQHIHDNLECLPDGQFPKEELLCSLRQVARKHQLTTENLPPCTV